MKTRIILIVVLAMVFSLAWMDSLAFTDKATLKGLKGIAVVIEDLCPELNEVGLTERQIQTDVELKLRSAGIKVLTIEKALKEKDSSLIYINVNSFKYKQRPQGWFVYNIICNLNEHVFLERNPYIKTLGTTWQNGYLGIGNIKAIRESVKDRIDQFINAYLSVNLKE